MVNSMSFLEIMGVIFLAILAAGGMLALILILTALKQDIDL